MAYTEIEGKVKIEKVIAEWIIYGAFNFCNEFNIFNIDSYPNVLDAVRMLLINYKYYLPPIAANLFMLSLLNDFIFSEVKTLN